jgi:hypothetical protein
MRSGLLAAALCVFSACDRGSDVATQQITDEDTPARLAEMVTEMMPQLERLSGLERRELIRLREQDRDAVRNYVEARLREEMPDEHLEGVRATYALLGLIPDTLNLRALLLDLYTEQVLGYYDPETTTLYVVSGAPADALAPVVAHELVHALQDQHANLDSLISRERGNDRQTAAHAAMEGHAMLVMFTYLAELASGAEVDPVSLPSPAVELAPALEQQQGQYPVFQRAPRIVRETLLFPYISGSDFVHTLWSHQAGGARPAPLDTWLPQSTQQVLEPLEHFIRQRTEPLSLHIDAGGIGGVLFDNTLGQLETGIYLAQHLGEQSRATASGWRGDRFVVVRGDGGDGMLWVSVWQSDDVARRFADAVRRVQRAGRTIAVENFSLDGMPAVRVVDVPANADTALRDRLSTLAVTRS